MSSPLIHQQHQLDELCQTLSTAEFIAIDTEFMRERTYFSQLALIQIASDEVITCIDPLALDDLSPLKEIFRNPAITKVFHAASQDVEIFYHLFGETPQPLFDTQVAATILGHGDQIGYATLVKDLLNVELDKSHSRTDWLQRPLEPKQIEYAEDDVRYLARIYPLLLRELESRGRNNWLDEDFAALTDPLRYRPDPETAWHRVKGLSKLRGVQLAILQKLAAWREEQAIVSDTPRRRVAADNILLDIARLKPKSIETIHKIRGIPESLVRKHGQKLLNCIHEAESQPKELWPKLPRPKRLSSQDEALVDTLSAIIKLCAERYQINPASLTSRKELEQLVRGDRALAILQGWRRHHGGEELLEFLAGKSSVQNSADGLVLISNG